MFNRIIPICPIWAGAAIVVALQLAAPPALASDTPSAPAEISLTDAELPLDVQDVAPPPPPLSRAGVLADLNDTGAVAASKFFSGFNFSGEIRARYEGIWDDTRPGTGVSDRERGRFAARLGFTKKINDRATAGFRVATGVGANPASTFQSFDNAALGKALSIDQAYLDLTLFPSHPDFHVILGKHQAPFKSPFWDRDVQTEGVSETWKLGVWPWTFWANAGQYFLEDNAAPDDPYLLSEQIGLDYSRAGALGLRWGASVGHLHFVRPFGIDATAQSGSNFTSAQHQTPSGFGVLDANGYIAGLLGALPVRVSGGFVTNLSASPTSVTGREEDQGWTAELAFGTAAADRPRSWEVAGGWRIVEADAIPGQFTESEFTSLRGNTDIEGWQARAVYIPWKNTTWTVSAYGTQSASARITPDRARIETNLGVKF